MIKYLRIIFLYFSLHMVASESCAQVLLSENFEGSFPPTGWTLENAGLGNSWQQNVSPGDSYSGTKSMEVGPYYPNAWAITPAINLVANEQYRISYFYKTNNSSFAKTLEVTMGKSANFSQQTTVLYSSTNIRTTDYYENLVIFKASESGKFYFGFHGTFPNNSGAGYLFVDSVVIQGINAPCTGIPDAGVVSAPFNACAKAPFRIYLSNNYFASNISFQWQSSPVGANNFSDINGDTLKAATVVQSAVTDYRCKVFCNNTGLYSISNVVSVSLKSGDSCHCTPTGVCNAFDAITNVTFAGINNTSGCGAAAYGDYFSSVAPANVTAGTSVPISVTVGSGAISYAAAWIDLNNDGFFDSSEYTYLGRGSSQIITSNIFIPSSIPAGLKRMRIRLRSANAIGPNDACVNFPNGDTEDYGVFVNPAKIAILHTPFADTLYNPTISIFATIKQTGVGINTTDSLSPRLWAKSQNSWKSFKGVLASGTANDGTWKFLVQHDSLGIRHNDCAFVQYYFVAQDVSDTPNIGYLPEPGGLHTNVRTQINPPTVLFGYQLKPRMKDTVYVSNFNCRFKSLSGPNGLFEEIEKKKLEGNLTIMVESDLDETGSFSLSDSSQNGYKVTIRPDGNTVRSITHAYKLNLPTGELATIELTGAKNILIDGSYKSSGEYLRFISEPASSMDIYDIVAGIRISGNADSIMVKNCSFRLENSSKDIGEASIVIGQGVNKNISIVNNEFSGISPSFLAERHLVNTGDSNIVTIRGNRFDDYRESAINIATPVSNWIIDSNHFYRTAIPTDYSSSSTAINVTGSNNVISGNYIGGSAPYCAGLPMRFVNNPKSDISGIKVSPTAVNLPNIIIDNKIANIDANTGGGASEASSFMGIVTDDNNCIIKNNIIGDTINNTPSITILADQIGGILCSGSQEQDFEISGNIVAGLQNNIINGFSGATRIYGIFCNNVAAGYAASTASFKIQQNKIFNLNNTQNTSAPFALPGADLGGTAGIFLEGGTHNLIEQNEIHNLNVTTANMSGIIYLGGPFVTDTSFIRRNNIYDLSNTNPLEGSIINGIGINNGNSALDIVNNRISANNRNLVSPVSIKGIVDGYTNKTSTPAQRVIYNSVYIGGASAKSGGSAGFFSIFSRINSICNNIFYNERTGGTQGHYAYQFNISPDDYPLRSNNNLFVLSDTALFIDYSKTSFGNFADWKLLNSRDSSSYFTSPTVIPSSQFFIDKNEGNLNIDPTKDICWYANGKALPFDGIKADFDSADIRSDDIQDGATDIGSDEFTTSTVPPLLTVYGRHVPGGADTLSCNGRIVAVITWGNGGALPTLGNCRWYSGVWPNDTTNNGTAISANYLNAYWSIPATGGANYSYSMKLFYDPSILGKITSSQDMVINKKEINVPGTWTVITPTINNVAEQTLTINEQSSFSEFTATDLLHALPTGLVLNGLEVNNDIKLTWEDLNAANNQSYGIERSKDGITFGNIANIAANTAINYQYTDVDVLKTAPVFYYRLSITNNANKISYSNILSFVNGESNGPEITKVYPNPFTKQITLEISSGKEQTISLRLLSANGSIVKISGVKIAKGNSFINMDLPHNIARGAYLLQIITEKGSYSFKLVKN
jgi:hypothetical protein